MRSIIQSCLFGLLFLAWAGMAFAQKAPGAQVASGIKLYKAGEYQRSMEVLQEALSSGDRLSPEERVEAYKYTAFDQVALGDPAGARASFRQALQLAPNLTLDPTFVPPKIISVFEEARAGLRTVPPKEKGLSSRRFSLSLSLGGYQPSDTSYSKYYSGPGVMSDLRFTYTLQRRIDFDLALGFFRKAKTKDTVSLSWDARTLTPSARYRFLSDSRLQPYLGAGIPIVILTGQFVATGPGVVAKIHSSGSGFMALGGCDALLNDRFALFAEARYYSLRFTLDRWELNGISFPVSPAISIDQSGGYFGGGLRFKF